jgi:hypothetical protein
MADEITAWLMADADETVSWLMAGPWLWGMVSSVDHSHQPSAISHFVDASSHGGGVRLKRAGVEADGS